LHLPAEQWATSALHEVAVAQFDWPQGSKTPL
jgi:hypothetical protein